MLSRLQAAFASRAEQRAFLRWADRGYKVIKLSFPNRIGHLCIEIDALLKDTILRGEDTRRFLLPDLGPRFANRHIIEYFKQRVRVERDDALVRFLGEDHLSRAETVGVVATHPYAVAMYTSAKCYEVSERWGDRGPLFELSSADDAFREEYFRRLGLPPKAWYVCLHAREGGYSPTDEAVHSFRSVSIESYEAAVRLIIDRGGWVFRMGDASMRPFSPHPRVIDYALTADKSERMDIALCGRCHFFLGSSSGPTVIASIFGRPSIVANMAPMGATLGYSLRDLSIAQHMTDNEGTRLSIAAQMEGPLSSLRLTEEFVSHGVRLVPNTPEEIASVTSEMLDRLDGRVHYSADDEYRQQLFKSMYRDRHYCYRAPSKMGRAFLRENLQ